MRFAAWAASSFFLLAAGAELRAQDPRAATVARAVVDSFFQAVRVARWADAVTLLDMPVFERFFRQRVNNARVQLPQSDATVEELMSRDSTLPRAVAEWQVKSLRDLRGRPAFGDFSYEFAGVTSFRALQALTPAEAAARWLEAQDPVTRYRHVAAQTRCLPSILDSMRIVQVLDEMRPRSVGAVAIDDSTAYVLVADRVSRDESDQLYSRLPTTIRMRRRFEGWRIVPNHQLLAGTSFGFSIMGSSCGAGRG